MTDLNYIIAQGSAISWSGLGLAIAVLIAAGAGVYIGLLRRWRVQARYQAEQLARTRSALDREISDRKEIQQELGQARHEAEKAGVAKGEFLANISHEIRTPLNGIIGMTEILLDSELTLEQREYAEMVSDSAGALLSIMNEILDFSKVESGQMSLERTPFDLKVMAEELAKMLAFKAQEKKIELIVRYDPDAPRRFLGDPVRLRQVLTNLVSNAIKFTPQGFVLLNVACQRMEGDQANLKFSVEDSGIGISEDKVMDIFCEFTQGDASATRPYGGTGLGLAICKRMVEMMGGQIQVKSSPEDGSIFWFALELTVDQNAAAAPLHRGNLEGVRVLVVDDNEINRRVYHEQLDRWEITNQSCVGPGEAIEALRIACSDGAPYHLMILDYELGDTTGVELSRVIKADSKIRDVEIVMVSSWARKLSSQTLTQAGVAGYLMKPVDETILLETLQSVWGAKEKGVSGSLITRHTLAESKAAAESTAPKEKKPITALVLVVEDNLANQKLAQALLQKIGCRVEVAAHGQEALDLMENHSYDLILMDCQMPVMDGYEATRRIRQREGDLKHTPIVAMTANAMQGDRQKCLDSGMDDYISKPIKKEVFYDTSMKYLTSRVAIQAPRVLKVLLVDDDENFVRSIQRSFRSVLPSADFKSTLNGVHACSLLGSFLPNVVIMDIRMPGMDGVEVIRFIKNNTRYSNIRIVVATGVDKTDPRLEAAKKMGITDFLYKPFPPEELANAVKQIAARVDEKKIQAAQEKKNKADKTPVESEERTGADMSSNAKCESPRGAAIFDPASVLRTLEGDTQMLKEITAIFLDASESDMQQLNAAVASLDVKTIEQRAHSMKGAASNIGAEGVCAAAMEMEHAAKNQQTEGIGEMFTSLQKQMDDLKSLLGNFDWQSLKVV